MVLSGMIPPYPPKVDKSAVCTINRHLLEDWYVEPGIRLTFSRNFLFKDQKKNRQKGEWPDERLPARTGHRTSPATRFSSLVAHRLCAPSSRPDVQSSSSTVGWSTGLPGQ